MQSTIYILASILLAELLTQLYVKWIRKHFQWLITPADEYPVLDPKALAKFLISGYDPALGWIRKPNTEHGEIGKYGPTSYHIDDQGSRANPEHKHLPLRAVCYGDSFTFCRQVNDNETWPWHLSELLQGNVLNFGVGNYGLDQAILRFERESKKHSAPLTIMGVVPSTIVRILSSWKHYSEYGNTFAFKPRFDLQQGKLVLIPNPIDSESKYSNYRAFLPQIQATDSFYESKFKKEMVRFPYLLHTLKNPTRNLPIIAAVTYAKLFNRRASSAIKDLPLQKIMEINLQQRVALFKNREAVDLLLALVWHFKQRATICQSLPIFLWLPQKDDLLFVRSNYNYYADVIAEIGKHVEVVDLTGRLLEASDLDSLYSDDGVYGGHLSNSGNAIVAKTVYEKIKMLNSK